MPGILLHSPAEIVARLITQLGHAVDPSPSLDPTSWGAYSHLEPPKPANCITTYDTQGTDQGRTMPDGERATLDGVQVRFRAATFAEGFVKANAVAIALDQQSMVTVAIDGTRYLVIHFMRTSGPINVGKEPGSSLAVLTVNGLLRVVKNN